MQEKKPKGFGAYYQLSARYSDEQAQNMLRKKLYQYKEVHPRFIRKVEEQNAFYIQKTYVAVYCGKADVRYEWKTKVNKEEILHEEIRLQEKQFTDANKDLDALNFKTEKLPEVKEKKKSGTFRRGKIQL